MCGIFIAMYAITMPGIVIIIRIPATVGSVVLSLPMNAVSAKSQNYGHNN